MALGCDGAPVLLGDPARSTGTHTIPMAKIVDPRILDMVDTPVRAPRPVVEHA
jgi:hypothetical protein